MKDKLRELAERWKAEASQWMIRGEDVPETLSHCAAELITILDADGNGWAVYQCMCTDSNVDSDGNEHEDDGRVWLDVPKDDFDTLSKRSDMRSRILYPHPARSGVVSDEDVRDAEFFRWHYSKECRTESNALVTIEIRILNDDWPTIGEVRAAYAEAIDAAIQGERHE